MAALVTAVALPYFSFSSSPRQIGETILNGPEIHGKSFLAKQLCFPDNPRAEQAFVQEWNFRQKTPDWCHYAQYQFDHGYYNRFNPAALQKLSPGIQYLSDPETRKMYTHGIKTAIPCVTKGLGKLPPSHKLYTPECYDRVIAASRARNNFKKDARIRSRDTDASLLESRNRKLYGNATNHQKVDDECIGEMDDATLIGKYQQPTKDASCQAAIEASMRSSERYNLLAQLSPYIPKCVRSWVGF